jgi:hypothetical protein
MKSKQDDSIFFFERRKGGWRFDTSEEIAFRRTQWITQFLLNSENVCAGKKSVLNLFITKHTLRQSGHHISIQNKRLLVQIQPWNIILRVLEKNA